MRVQSITYSVNDEGEKKQEHETEERSGAKYDADSPRTKIRLEVKYFQEKGDVELSLRLRALSTLSFLTYLQFHLASAIVTSNLHPPAHSSRPSLPPPQPPRSGEGRQ